MDHVKLIWLLAFVTLTEYHSFDGLMTNCSILPVSKRVKKFFFFFNDQS